MESQYREITLEDYKEICGWWQAQGWPPIPLSDLPNTGVIVHVNGEPSAAGFLYKTDSSFCVLEFIVGNPKADKAYRRRGIDVLLEALLTKAKTAGYTRVFSSIQHPRLEQAYLAAGFTVTDTGMKSMVKSL